ncbi:MAG TPA: glycerol-3-phosphate 1-O-acyltransferase PlsY [Candidatus Binatia bacterium]|nr:glycerol-3-phosphate 1-O-acyltransferase PlsY [Candidatus Binatia bacterium]
MLTALVLVMLAYLLGSVPTGYILGTRAGVDVRKAGSGNIGATNVARVVGMRPGVFTLIGDVVKGFVPVVVALQLGLSSTATGLVGIAAFLGHLYPVFLKFQGGKGVATALGVFLGVSPVATLVLIVVFAVVVLTSRFASLGSLIAAASAPIVLWLLSYPPVLIAVSTFIACMITVRHRTNIQRLIAGTEPKFGY